MQSQQLPELKISYAGRWAVAKPFAVNGTGLLCMIEGAGSVSQGIVLEYQAADKEQFWRAWRALGGEQQGLRFESGEKFKPPCQPQRNTRTLWQKLCDYLWPPGEYGDF